MPWKEKEEVMRDMHALVKKMGGTVTMTRLPRVSEGEEKGGGRQGRRGGGNWGWEEGVDKKV